MSRFERWGRLVARRRRTVIGAWAVALVAGLALVPVFLANIEGVGFLTPGTDSERAVNILQERSGVAERAPLVISTEGVEDLNSDFPAAVSAVVASVRGIDHVRRVIPPAKGEVSEDGRTAVATVLLSGDDGERQEAAEKVQERVEQAAPDGVVANLTGSSALFVDLIHVEEADLVKAEAVGIPIAGLILLLAFGTLVAAGLPLLVAITGLTITFGLLGLVTLVMDVSVFIENIVAMVGLGVGIDYALLIVRRFREERAEHDDETALGRTMATAGRTVIFSGATVVMTLVPMVLVGIPFFTEIAIGAALVVVVMVLAALSLVPAALASLGGRIDRLRMPLRRRPTVGNGWVRWTNFVMRRPWVVLGVTLVVLGLMAAPALNMRTGIDLGVRAYSEEPAARGLESLQKAFPGSTLSPVNAVLTASTPAELRRAQRAATAVMEADPRVATVGAGRVGPGAVVVSGSPSVATDSPRATELVHDLRRELDGAIPAGADVSVGGLSAESADFTTEIEAGIPFVVGGALFLCFLVLLVVFRSPFLALKAVFANLLSIAASFGLVVLVFQEGLGEEVLGFTSPGFLQSYIPLALFVLVYGLSMDYEVFIVSRIREEWQRNGGDTPAAIAAGLQRTGGLVTSAAAIMVAVFFAFMLTRVPEIKQFGFGLGAAIAIDATIVRAALVPSIMRVAGSWNWWEPKLMTRILDRNKKPQPEPELAAHL